MDDYLNFAKSLADDAAEIMLQYFQVGVTNKTKPTEGNTPVTIADETINSMVIASVRQAFPDHAVVGEEESYLPDNAQYSWVCDPVDGTIPYVMGVPTNVFSLALVGNDGQPIVAVVNDPYMKRMYWATKDGGAFMNGDRLQVNAQDDMAQTYIGSSGSRSNTVQPNDFKAELLKMIYRPIMLNCSIYEAMLVASGQMAATVYLGKGAHDVATSKLIIEEAGGKVTDVFGDEQRYDKAVKGAIMSNGLVHDALLALASRHQV